MLAGIRVLDLTSLLPGPYASLLLADMGAEVIKVESPLGDMTRQVAPFANDRSAFFTSLNRNKLSLCLDLRKPAGSRLFLDLARRSDVVLEGFRPGRAKRLGVGPEAALEANPQLVYCSISGYGQDGPDASRAGHDLTYLARTGLLGLNRRPGEAPVLPPIQIADLAAGTNAALAICAALVDRGRTGRGRALDISMLESALAWAGPLLAMHQAGHEAAPGTTLLGGLFPFYNVYATADGGFVALAAVEPIFWREFCRAVDRPDLVSRQFAGGAARAELFREMEAIFASRTTGEWATEFRQRDLAAEVVSGVEAVFDDEHLAARGSLMGSPHPAEGELRQVAPPLRTPGVPAVDSRPPPHLGADTRRILTGILEIDPAAVEELIRDRIALGPDEASPRRAMPDRLA